MDARAKDGAIRNQVGMLAMSPIGLDEEQNATVDFFGTLKARQEGGGFEGSVFVPQTAQTLRTETGRCQIETNYVSHCLNAGTFQNTGHGWWNESPVAQTIRTPDGSGSMEANVVAVASTGQTSHCLNAGGMGRIDYETETLVTGSLKVGGGKPGQGYPAAVGSFGVRRLTPVECEKLQGFEPGYTALDKAADGPRYKALGNSMAVPCVAFICDRIKRAIETWDNKENSRRTSGGLNLK
jgi:site-specific DNA-cytosine methylase